VRLAMRALVVVLLAGATTLIAVGHRPTPGHDRQATQLDPAQFTTAIDHPFWPMVPGSRWVYREVGGDGERQVEVTVTWRTRTVLGIEARVVHEVVTQQGRLQKASEDWFAQDRQGNLWQLGEAGREYHVGRPRWAAESWQAGVGGAQAIIVVPGHPNLGTVYRPEGAAATQVLSAGTRASVPYGSFDHLVITKESSTPQEPKRVEHEFYARGVGPVLAITVSGGSGREELVEFDDARGGDRAPER
jgi:hypothetical protein